MKKIIGIILFSFLLNAYKVQGQDSCNCNLNLDFIIDKVTHNYAGYRDKVNSKTTVRYNAMVDSLKTAAAASKSLKECFGILNTYRLFFYDKHLQLWADLPQVNSTETFNPTIKTTAWTKQKITRYLGNNSKTLDNIEGIWVTEGYEIGIVKTSTSKGFEAIILSAKNPAWKEGMVKFECKKTLPGEYKTIYARGDFKKDTISLFAEKNFLETQHYGIWQKHYPSVKDSITQQTFQAAFSRFSDVQVRQLNNTTMYIRLRSCDLGNKAILDSLLKLYSKNLATMPDWIIDFRGNNGGSTDVFLGLLPYLYTKPFIEKGNQHWMTADNTKLLKQFVGENKAAFDSSTLKYLTNLTDFGDQHPGGWYNDHGDTTTFDKVLPYPKRVAVLSDKNNGSSGETFLMVAHGISDKTIIFGENSAGYLDYGDLMEHKLPCNKLGFAIPVRRANYLDFGVSYDRTGYPPDVVIKPDEKDWLPFVFRYWASHKAISKQKIK